MNVLAIPKNMRVKKPRRQPDMYSKRNVPYWFGPNWVRLAGQSYGRIIPVLNENSNKVELHMLSADGNLSYIQGSIQYEFQEWLESTKKDVIPWRDDLVGDCLILGISPSEVLLNDWEYEEK
jgi:hypothetical protein